MVVDGIAAEQIQEIMENEIYGIEEPSHQFGRLIFKTAGTSSPDLRGVRSRDRPIGALGNLEDVEALGHDLGGLRGDLMVFSSAMSCLFPLAHA